jgi:hypothetical protein
VAVPAVSEVAELQSRVRRQAVAPAAARVLELVIAAVRGTEMQDCARNDDVEHLLE